MPSKLVDQLLAYVTTADILSFAVSSSLLPLLMLVYPNGLPVNGLFRTVVRRILAPANGGGGGGGSTKT